MTQTPRQAAEDARPKVAKRLPWSSLSRPSQTEELTAAALGFSGNAGRFAGLLLLDHCPFMGDVTFGGGTPPAHGQTIRSSMAGMQVLSNFVSLKRLDPLKPVSWEQAACAALGVAQLPDGLPVRDAFRAAHPCAVLQIDMPPVATLSHAKLLMRQAAPCWLLALSLRVGAECEPFAEILLDRKQAKAHIEFYSGFAHAYFAHMNTASDFARRIVPGLARDPRMRLFAGLFRDFLREPEDAPAIVKGWALLEVMAAGEKGGKKEMVRRLCQRMETSPNGFFLNAHFAKGEDLLDVAYRHRNCVAHEGWCNESNSGCSKGHWQSACRKAGLIREDLQFLLNGLLTDFLGASTSWVVGSDGSRLEDRPGLYVRGGDETGRADNPDDDAEVAPGSIDAS